MLVELQKKFSDNNIELNQYQAQQFLNYLDLILRWNKVHNLTAIINPEEIILKHFLDSAILVHYLKPGNLIDIGSGAGLPGIPLAICEPEREITLLDSSQKKCFFLEHVARELKLLNVKVVHSRAADYRSPELFTYVVSRAVGSLTLLVTETSHLINLSNNISKLIAMKAQLGDNEIADLQRVKTSFVVDHVQEVNIRGLAAERCLIFLRPR